MPFDQPPSLHDLIVYLVRGALDRRAVLTRTKLAKLLYLLDVDLAASRRRPITGLRWRFLHYGPYAPELAAKLEEMEGRSIWTRESEGAQLLVRAIEAPDSAWWPGMLETRANRILDRWAPAKLNELLDYVYFRTGPMQPAKRGELLDLSLATRPPAQSPLTPPDPPDNLAERLSKWRENRRAVLAPADVGRPLEYVDLPTEPAIPEGTRLVADVDADPDDD